MPNGMRLKVNEPTSSVGRDLRKSLASETRTTSLRTPAPDGSVTLIRSSPELLCADANRAERSTASIPRENHVHDRFISPQPLFTTAWISDWTQANLTAARQNGAVASPRS